MKEKLLILFLLVTIMLTACVTEKPDYTPVENNTIARVALKESSITPFESDAPLPVENTAQDEIEKEDSLEANVDERETPSLETVPELLPELLPELSPSSNTPAPAPVEEPGLIHPEQAGWVRYSSGNLDNLMVYIYEGKVIYYEGEYWCSPELFEIISNEEIVYENDISGDDTQGRTNVLTPDAEFIYE
ncbi:MAG: hypothetical protein GX957_08600 [Clostridiaceae bacterium]|nr:hypothetical protein [Clostridiaceae bacterium]